MGTNQSDPVLSLSFSFPIFSESFWSTQVFSLTLFVEKEETWILPSCPLSLSIGAKFKLSGPIPFLFFTPTPRFRVPLAFWLAPRNRVTRGRDWNLPLWNVTPPQDPDTSSVIVDGVYLKRARRVCCRIFRCSHRRQPSSAAIISFALAIGILFRLLSP